MIAMSFPPVSPCFRLVEGYINQCELLQLFGHELVAMICGLVWGIGIGFLIVALGTLLGELASFWYIPRNDDYTS